MRNKIRNKKLIIGLICILFLMTAGYAAFQTKLEIDGTTNISSKWDIKIISAEVLNTNGTAENVKNTYTQLTADLEANFSKKGDYIEYKIIVENSGTFDAKLETLGITNSNNEAIKITSRGLVKGQTLYKESTAELIVKIEYNSNYNGDASGTSGESNITLEFVQASGGTITPTNDHLVTYDYVTNGGESTTAEDEYITEGENINLSYTATRKNHNFIGWNTDAKATVGLTNLTMGQEDIVLYAIFDPIDKTAPIIDSVNTTTSSNSVTVVVTAHDDETDIVKYEYSIDGGETWIESADNTYTFEGLEQGEEYTIKVKVTNEMGLSSSEEKQVTTNGIPGATFRTIEEELDYEIVEITYPEGCGTTYTCSYRVEDYTGEVAEEDVVTSQTVEIEMIGDGVIIAIVSDGDNETVSTYTVSLAPVIKSWSTSNGYENNTEFHSAPYKTNIVSATFLDTKIVPEGAVSWDVSERGDGSVMAWVIADETDPTKYHLYIGGDGGVIANVYSDELFNGMTALTSIDFGDNFDTSQAESMSAMFGACRNLTTLDLSSFDTSKVTNMSGMFAGMINLTNVDLSSFDTSNVEDMSAMFDACNSLTNLDVSNFDTSNVTDMSVMFAGMISLTNLDLNNFDTSNVVDMSRMFYGCEQLTRLSLCSFDTRKIESHLGYAYVFYDTPNLSFVGVGPNWSIPVSDLSLFNNNSGTDRVTKSESKEQCLASVDNLSISTSTTSTTKSITVVVPAESISGIEKYEYSIDGGETWVESNSGTYTFNGLDQGEEYTVKVKVTSNSGAVVEDAVVVETIAIEKPTFSQIDNIVTITYPEGCGSDFTCSYIKNDGQEVVVTDQTVNVEFSAAGNLIAKVSDGRNEVTSAYTFSEIPTIKSWSSNRTTEFHSSEYKTNIITAEFVGSKTVPEGAVSWDVSEAGDGSVMAWVIADETDSTKYHLYIGGNGGVKANFLSSYMFAGLTSLKSINFADNFDTSNVSSFQGMFKDCVSLETLDLSSFNTTKVTSTLEMFSNCSNLTSVNLNGWNTTNLKNMNHMFSVCSSLLELDLSHFDTSNVEDMGDVFHSCTSLKSLNVDGWDTSKVTNMNAMFYGLNNIVNLNVSHFDTSNVTDVSSMFYQCYLLKSLDLSNFNLSKVDDLGDMFYECRSLSSLNIDGWDTSNVVYMDNLFYNCYNLTNLNISDWDTSKVIDMTRMFQKTSGIKELDLSSWNVSNVTTMYSMFSDCTSLEMLNLSGWNTAKLTNSSKMFRNCSSLINLNLCSFNTSKVTYSEDMFAGINPNIIKVYVGTDWTLAEETYIIKSDNCMVSADEMNVDIATTSTTKSITVVTTASSISGIAKYEYSIDGGESWVEGEDTYTFEDLNTGEEYNIVVKVTTNSGAVFEEEVIAEVNQLEVPTYEENDNIVTITYPEGCGSEFTCSYIKDGGQTVNVTTETVDIEFTSSGSLTASVSDGTNTANSSYLYVMKDYYVSSSGSDETGDGTKENPYATIAKAYSEVIQSATIYVMDDLSITSNITFADDKDVTLTSYSENGDTNKVVKSTALNDYLLTVTNGSLILENIEIDGNNVSDLKGGISVSNANLDINEGAIIQNFVVTDSAGAVYGGGLRLEHRTNATATLNGGIIRNNSSPSNGGVVIGIGDTFVINSGSVSYNSATVSTAGGIYNNGGTLEINGGSVSNNTAQTSYGGIRILADDSQSAETVGTFTMTGGTISNNQSITGSDGGLGCDANTTCLVSGGTITGNTTDLDGNTGAGGVSVAENAEFTLSGNAVISENISAYGGGLYCRGNCTLSGGTISANESKNGAGIYTPTSSAATVTIDGATITNNIAESYGGAYYFGKGTLTMISGTISNNTATYGGAVYVPTNAATTFNMSGGTLTENSATTYGGAIDVRGGTFTMTGGTISNNEANYGGAIFTASNSTPTININGGTISGNEARTAQGGGIYVYGTLNITDGTISNNTAATYGGGIQCLGTCSMTGGTITNNTAGSYGGGIRVGAGGNFTLNGGTISNNTATTAGGGISKPTDGTYTYVSGYVCGNTPSNSYDTSGTCATSSKPTITLSPNSQDTYIADGKKVTATISDTNGIKASQKVYYAWSKSSSTAPTYSSYVTTTNTAGATKTTVSIPASSSAELTGVYYLWIKAGTVADTNGNTNAKVTSDAFKFDNTAPTVKLTLTPNKKGTVYYKNGSGTTSTTNGAYDYATVSFTRSDAHSGVDTYSYSCTGKLGSGTSYTLSTGTNRINSNLPSTTVDGLKATCVGTATDAAGNTASVTSTAILGNGWEQITAVNAYGKVEDGYDWYYWAKGSKVTGWVSVPTPESNWTKFWYYFYNGSETSANNTCYGKKYTMARSWCKNVGGYSGWYYLVYLRYGVSGGVSNESLAASSGRTYPGGAMVYSDTVTIDGSRYTFNSSGKCTAGSGC